MGDSHKGQRSLDQRFAQLFSRLIQRFITPRLPALIAATSAAIVGVWYAENWLNIYTRTQRTLHGKGDPDVILGLIAATIFTAGFATSLLIRLIPTEAP